MITTADIHVYSYPETVIHKYHFRLLRDTELATQKGVSLLQHYVSLVCSLILRFLRLRLVGVACGVRNSSSNRFRVEK